VIVTLGHRKDSPEHLIQSSVKNVIDSMKKHNVKRLVLLAGAGTSDPKDENTFGRRFIRFLLRTLAKKLFYDLENTSQLVEAEGSSLDWTVVRPPRIVDKPETPKGQYRSGYLVLSGGAQISRADVAHFMLSQIADNQYFQQRPMVTW
jgi:putative NADH-flavin reductase